ncbi:MAG: TolC family protein [Desulfuromonadales bacterium]|nr:TolC family protein [Desulfuromonadales bacterium]
MFLRLIPLGTLCALTGLGVLAPPAGAVSEPSVLIAEERVLTLEAALELTLRSSPDLAVATEELHAVEAEAQLAGRLSNPELTVSLENVAGDGSYQDTDAAELTIELSQPLELGGKRRLRREAAELDRQLAASEQQRAQTDVRAVTRQRYVEVLAAQEALTLAREQADLAEKSLHAAEERINAGKAPLIDRLRLQGEASLARLAAARAERTLVTTRQALAASWGASQPDFDRVAGDLATLPAAPDPGDVDITLEQSPEAISRRIAAELRGNQLAQAKARRIPDPSLTVGWRQFEESNEDALLFGISFPLPLFNQGQHEVAAASRRLHGAKARELSTRNQARSTLRSARQALADARAEAEVLGSQVVPAAAEGFAAAEFGYRAGKFGLLELLDAQRALFDARQRQLAARTACHLAAIELQRLQGSDAGAVTP